MGTFPQYKYPHTLRRYCEIAEMLGIQGKNDEEKFRKLIEKIDQLKKDIECPLTIQEAGIDEKAFLDSLEPMSEAAFNDQCTGTNPRYPLISEMKELYLEAYYGPEAYAKKKASLEKASK
jgi:acetaldehyde dehydrogenase/alcohol dehydrogenase